MFENLAGRKPYFNMLGNIELNIGHTTSQWGSTCIVMEKFIIIKVSFMFYQIRINWVEFGVLVIASVTKTPI